ncbi:hypothetical protein JCM8115_002127 [Rhodotorula mucilaginosa]|uniref:Uncharacterized protein n=1 Tax=Rhodotorula mucilaginosa TaxID=5537 RepID=A0A9P6W1N9_RHOMI|nr:hypothetical protein C6P46_004012 [Rhodotorula mucilaginosa]
MMAAATDGSLLTCLLISACALSGITTGLLLVNSAIAIPALFAAPLSARARLHVWSRLEAESSSLVGSLLPLLSGSLALCALLARSTESDATAPALGGGEGWISRFLVTVAQNRRSLFVLAAILTLALRPYSFGLLTPRIEALEAEERRLLLLGLRARNSRGHSTGLDRALGRSGWRGASPTLEEQEKSVDEKGNENGNGNGNGNGNESDEEDNGFDSEDLSEGDESELQAGVAKVRDTDRLILELSRLQLGPAILCGAAFALTVLDLACA